MAEFLFCRFNARGRKQFKNLDRNGLKEKYPTYANLGLPAHKAALDGNLDALKEVFTAYNEDGVPSRDRNGATPLHLAARNNNLETVKWLIRYTDLSPLDVAKHGETPVHVAAAQSHTDCLKLLVNAESKTDIKGKLASAIDNSGYTALHLATVKQSNDCAKILIGELGSKGVGPLSESGVTAAHVAASSGNVEVLKMISQKYKKTLSHQAEDGTTPLYFAAQEGRLDALKFLAEKCKCDLSTMSEDGLKPIHAAAQCGHTHIVKYIVSQKGNQAVFEQTPDKATPLHFAACSGNLESARWLINSDLSGALITAKDKNGDTPAHDAADNGQTAVLKLLLESGADLYAYNNEGNTPYSLALSGGDPDMANFVMSYASKSPQKVDQEPAKMTIYDLQGDVDVVDFEVGPPTEQKQQQQDEPEQFEVDKPAPISNEPKRGDKTSAFLKSATQTLQSFDDSTTQPGATTTDDKDDLEWTEEELDIFKQEQKPVASSGTSEDIIVRYSADVEYSPKKQLEQPMTSEYATVNEIAVQAEKREKKRGRKISKSIKNALRSRKKVSDAKRQSDTPKKGFGGNEMGFKPQFHSNPLQKMSGPRSLLPTTPPPTPATTASNEAAQHQVDDDDEDSAPYDMYATPDPEVVKKKAERRKQQEESENTKLLENTLEELSGGDETPPPIPEQKLSEETKDEVEQKKGEEQKAGTATNDKSVSKLWPPPANDLPDRPNGPKSGSANVLRKWPPASGGNSLAEQQLQQKKPPIVGSGKKWMPPSKQNTPEKKPGPIREPLPVLKPTTPKAPEPVVSRSKPPPPKEQTPQKMFAVLKPVKRDAAPKEQQQTELSKIKLKRADDKRGAIFSHPESEQTSGASDELKQILKKVAN